MIEAKTIDEIADTVKVSGLDDTVMTQLRTSWPDIHFTFCSEDDICQARPVYESDMFYIYLVDSRNHCLSFTSNYQVASGVVIAECEEDL